MSFKGKLKLWLERLKFQWQGCGKLMYIPFLVNYIIFGLTVYVIAKNSPNDTVTSVFVTQMYYFVPIMSVWWIMLILQEYVESDGHEVLWVYDKNKVWDVIAYTVFYIVSLLPHLDIGLVYLDVEMETFLLIFAQCIFYSGVTFALSMMTGSIVSGFVFAIAYTLYIKGRLSEIISAMEMYGLMSKGGYLFAGVIFFILGMTFSFQGGRKK